LTGVYDAEGSGIAARIRETLPVKEIYYAAKAREDNQMLRMPNAESAASCRKA
jgi:hypothetical protein